LRLRIVQLRRDFTTYGLVLLGIAVCVLPWLVRQIVESDANYKYYLGGAVLLSMVGLHQRRLDLDFVRKHLPFPRSELIAEYALLALPIALGFWCSNAWREGLMLFGAVLCIPWMPVARVSARVPCGCAR